MKKLNLALFFPNAFVGGSLVFFICYIGIVLTAMFVFKPGWGFMDDSGNLEIARQFWQGHLPWGEIIQGEIDSGRFRPLYFAWIILAYTIPDPLVIYLLVFIMGVLTIWLWGRILALVFPSAKSSGFLLYIYPLMSFTYIPFWNIFMFISIQEKFIYFFGSLAVYFLVKAYDKTCLKYVMGAIFCACLALLGKETALSLFIAFFFLAICDLFFLRSAVRMSMVLALMSGVIILIYGFFIQGILGNYSTPYKMHLQASHLWNRIWELPGSINLLLGFVSATIIFYVLFKKRIQVAPSFLIFPFFILSFIAVLVPWNFYHYLLSPLGPFLAAIGYLFLSFIFNIRLWLEIALKILISLIIMANLVTVIIPYIHKMGDKPKIVEALKRIAAQNKDTVFFYPPPYIETSQALQQWTQTRVIYTKRLDPQDLKFCHSSCYLVLNDETDPVQINISIVTQEVYANQTWRVLRLYLSHF